MSQVVARPYAKALFEHAVATNAIPMWAARLATLSAIVHDPDASAFLGHPLRSAQQQMALLLAPFSKADLANAHLVNWISILLSEGRVAALPEIERQYLALQAEFEKNITVNVKSFSALTADQKNRLTEKLQTRLKRHVVLNIQKDKSLLGGMIIQAGDWVLDGSVRGKLKALHTDLCAL